MVDGIVERLLMGMGCRELRMFRDCGSIGMVVSRGKNRCPLKAGKNEIYFLVMRESRADGRFMEKIVSKKGAQKHSNSGLPHLAASLCLSIKKPSVFFFPLGISGFQCESHI